MPHSKKSKRLQKKLYLGEFAVMGFQFSASMSDFDDSKFDSFFDLLIDFIESRELEIGGGGNKDKFTGFVSSNLRYGSASDDDRSALEKWLASQTGISEVVVQPLSDIYYGD